MVVWQNFVVCSAIVDLLFHVNNDVEYCNKKAKYLQATNIEFDLA